MGLHGLPQGQLYLSFLKRLEVTQLELVQANRKEDTDF
jgi:hypothetical protein